MVGYLGSVTQGATMGKRGFGMVALGDPGRDDHSRLCLENVGGDRDKLFLSRVTEGRRPF